MGLYTKIKGPVNYTVVGNPTITDNVVSGFSSSDYLRLNIINNDIIKANYLTNFEFQVKAILPNSFDKEQQIIYVPYRGVLSGFTIRENGKIRWYAMGGINVITSSTTFTGGTTIWIKGTVKNSVATLYSSIDGINWINEGSVTFTNFEYTALIPVRIGVDGQTTPGSIFNGSIDLNETYIKINDVAWFGTSLSKVKVRTGLTKYTVVGSPTISNGIASDFSTSNYLTIPQINLSTKNFEICICFKINEVSNHRVIGTNGASTVTDRMSINTTSNNKIRFYYTDGNSQYNVESSITYNTSYYYYVVAYRQDTELGIKVSTDKINWTTDNTTVSSDFNLYIRSLFYIGANVSSGTYFPGSIDLNESYIKVDNGYYWRGSHQNINAWKIQQNNFSKYYTIVDGKLTWASPNIYLESSSDNYGGDGVNAKQWINTNYIPSQGIEYEIDFTLFTSETSANNSFIMGTNCFGLEGHWNNNSNNALIYFNDNYTFTMTRNERHKVAVKKQNDNYNFYLDNVLQTTFTELTIAPTRKMYLFALNAYDSGRAAYASYSRIYKYKIWDNGTLLYHFVPVPKGLLIGNFVVPSNGMFDIVEQKFYGNEGTGDFAIGGIPQDYIIEGGKLIWCNSDIYLESSGTQYINTNILTSYDLSIDIEYYRESGYLFGYLGNMDGINKSFGYTSSGTNGYLRIGNWYVYNNTSWADNTWLKLHAERDKTKASINGTLFTSSSTGTPTDFNNGNNITLFQYNNAGGSNLVGKIKNFQVKQNLTILQYLVPVPKGMLIGNKIAPSNCMFDIVTQTFFENQGTGDFIIGGISGDYINIGDNIVWVDNNVYLKCNGAQYFDSGFRANQDTKVDIDYTINGSGTQALYCSRNNASTSTFTMFRPYGSSSTRFDYNTSQHGISGTVSSGTRYNVIADKNKCYIDNELKYTATYANFQSNMGMIFGCSGYGGGNLGNWGYHKYHKIQLYDNTKLIRYFLPVNTNTIIGSFTVPAPGMWDAVTKKFYPNKGSGSFTYGKDS